MKLPNRIQLIEVGPRDGFQNIKKWIPTELKIKIIDGLIQSGFERIEVTSFVHPKAIPQMKDAIEIVQNLNQKYKEIDMIALTPNLYGARSAWESGIKEITYVISASEAHNKANVNRTIEESFSDLERIRQELPELKIKLDIATVFGCPYEGEVSAEQVSKMIEKGRSLSVEHICLCDTIGIAHPLQMETLLQELGKNYDIQDMSLHLHDTRGMGLANTLIALEQGMRIFETALGGLGGCPFAPGAAGNIASEDMIYMLKKMNIHTGIELDRLLDTVNLVKDNIKSNLTGHMTYVGSCVE